MDPAPAPPARRAGRPVEGSAVMDTDRMEGKGKEAAGDAAGKLKDKLS